MRSCFEITITCASIAIQKIINNGALHMYTDNKSSTLCALFQLLKVVCLKYEYEINGTQKYLVCNCYSVLVSRCHTAWSVPSIPTYSNENDKCNSNGCSGGNGTDCPPLGII